MADPRSLPLSFPALPRVRAPVQRSTSWWGRAFVRSAEETARDPEDLGPARRFARSGRLGALVVIPSFASAVVDPRGTDPLLVQLQVEPLGDEHWDTFAEQVADQSGFLAALGAGELPIALVESCDDLGAEVLPGPEHLESWCECDAWARPCVHALALCYQLTWHLDTDPFVLLQLRGLSSEELHERVGLLLHDSPETGDVQRRAQAVLELAEGAPAGHGLADPVVAAYDEEISRLLGDTH